ncbi:alcohol dehydrogenase [Mycena capillaripes]|nr:alcohol dehydrogenase [Mycena capillaripes]
MSLTTYKRIVLNSRPVADIEPTTFRTETLKLSELQPGAGEVLIQVTWLSLDPAMRSYIRDVRSYLPRPNRRNDARTGSGRDRKGWSPEHALCRPAGWTEFAVMQDKQVDKVTVPKGVQALDFLNILGLTAYFGLRDICNLKPGDKLVVSGAAGSVGTFACQLGKRAGATVYAIAGAQDKCEWLEKDLGVDKAFNYKSPTFIKDFQEVGYIDAFFDNVGGDILDLLRISATFQGARIALCGAISQYNADATERKGLQNYASLIAQRAKIQGFLMHVFFLYNSRYIKIAFASFDYTEEWPAAIEEMARGLVDGSIKQKFHVVEGLEQAPVALPMLYSGGNTGKLVVKVSEEPAPQL